MPGAEAGDPKALVAALVELDRLPADREAAAEAVAAHPQRQEIRVGVGADRAGNRHGVARLAAQPDKLLGAADLVPGLAAALAHTLS
jgi:hypothetical protein